MQTTIQQSSAKNEKLLETYCMCLVKMAILGGVATIKKKTVIQWMYLCRFLYVYVCVHVGYLWLGRACWQWCSWQRWWRHTPTPRGPPLWVTWTVSCLGAEHCACFYWASLPAVHPAKQKQSQPMRRGEVHNRLKHAIHNFDKTIQVLHTVGTVYQLLEIIHLKSHIYYLSIKL